MQEFEYRVRGESAVRAGNDISAAFTGWKGDAERWLFVAPHDDDIVLGAGILLQAAKAAGIPLRMLVTTDGSMGYCTAEQRRTIKEVRAAETMDSFRALGIDDVRWLNFPDCSLSRNGGRRVAAPGDPCVIEGFTGMQNAYTREIRDFRPTRLFVPSGCDYHPDHKMVYDEVMISVFHAGGDIWPELGAPIPATPTVYEMAIYADFPVKPNLMVKCSPEVLERKLAAIGAYKSQLQIESLINNVRESGPMELYREIEFSLYQPKTYLKDFE